QERIRDAEDGGVGPEPEREGEDRCQREARSRGELADGVPEIVKQAAHEGLRLDTKSPDGPRDSRVSDTAASHRPTVSRQKIFRLMYFRGFFLRSSTRPL